MNLDYYGNSYSASAEPDDPEPDPSELIAVIRELVDVAQWYRSFHNDVKSIAPEYFRLCDDVNAAMYLHSEAENIRTRAIKLLQEWEPE